MNIELRDGISNLLRDAGQAHHKAFEVTDGADPDWPIWYAEYTRDTFAEQFGMDFTKSQLIFCLMHADFERQARAPESDWPKFYAEEILQRYAASATPDQDKLALYYFEGCPFSMMVLSAIERLDIDVELRDIHQDVQHRDDLIDARGRGTVPVLRITASDGEDRWMPESRDIIRYLTETYG